MKQTKFLIRLISSALVAFALTAVAFCADPWPATTESVNIGETIAEFNTEFEASGLAFSSEYGWVVAGDEGSIAIVSESGELSAYYNLTTEDVKYGFEGVAIADQKSDLAYFANEGSPGSSDASQIFEFDLKNGALTGKIWTLDLPVSGANGFEALAFVPKEHAPDSWGTAGVISDTVSGFFVAGTQASKSLYVYAINADDTGSERYDATIDTPYTDVSALDYNEDTKLLYVVHDTENKMKEYRLADTPVIVNSYLLPTSKSEEGFAVNVNCETGFAQAGITDDTITADFVDTPNLDIYENYPISCDQDNDGVFSDVDCNDHFAGIGKQQYMYYIDEDGDGIGKKGDGVQSCLIAPPDGFVANDDDLNDKIPNANVEIYGDNESNDGDAATDETNTLFENGQHPYYSTLSAKAKRTVNIIIATYKDGKVFVKYKDNSIYEYSVLNATELIAFKNVKMSMKLDSPLATVNGTIAGIKTSKTINLYTGAVN